MSLLNLLDLPIRHSDILMIPSLVIGSNFSIDPLSTLLATTDSPPPPHLPLKTMLSLQKQILRRSLLPQVMSNEWSLTRFQRK